MEIITKYADGIQTVDVSIDDFKNLSISDAYELFRKKKLEYCGMSPTFYTWQNINIKPWQSFDMYMDGMIEDYGSVYSIRMFLRRDYDSLLSNIQSGEAKKHLVSTYMLIQEMVNGYVTDKIEVTEKNNLRKNSMRR